jgi:ribosomal protein S18 acetylase RimI-like enzyme
VPHDGDWPAIEALMRVCFEDEVKAGGHSDTAESLASLCRAGGWCRVMALGEKIIGFVCLDHQSPHLSASKLAVAPEFRHKGYGAQLMIAAENAARALGVQKLCVAVMESNSLLRDWYMERLGYSPDLQFPGVMLNTRLGFRPIRGTVLSKSL